MRLNWNRGKNYGAANGANTQVRGTFGNMVKQINCTLTDAERRLINNFCEDEPRGRGYAKLNVRKYTGFNTALLALNGTAKNIGTAWFIKRENTWYFDAINGERYRIPEGENGIDAVLDIEFKRKDV